MISCSLENFGLKLSDALSTWLHLYLSWFTVAQQFLKIDKWFVIQIKGKFY